jgi:ribosomal protein S18 acetylase RimI-like enzyme
MYLRQRVSGGREARVSTSDTAVVSRAALATAVDRIRAAHAGTLWSNYFFATLRVAELPSWSADRSLVFLDRAHDFWRLYFLTYDLPELSALVRGIAEQPLVADYVTQSDDHTAIDVALRAGGFTKAAVYQRMTHHNLAARKAGSKICAAEEREIDVLFAQLCRHFDVRLDRVPEREQFAELVRRRQVLVRRHDGEIDGYVVYQLHGRRALLNYWYCRPGTHPAVAVRLLADFFTDMAAKGITSSFLWVRTDKTAEIGVYETLGYHTDGLRTHIYMKE